VGPTAGKPRTHSSPHPAATFPQVKLRGQRLELSEIEAIALSCPLVRAAAAAVWGDQLLLYVVPSLPSSA
jgi:hypothetical protein